MYKYLIILIMASAQALANGSETGHNTGNGHHGHPGSPTEISQSTVVDNTVSTQNTARSDARNSTVVRVTGRSEGGSGFGTASTGAVNLTGGNLSFVENNDYPASSAASLYTTQCQSGVSGQTRSGGFANTNAEQFCYLLKMAIVNWSAYERELTNISPDNCETVQAQITCPAEGYVDCQLKSCKSPLAAEYLSRYHSNMDDAQAIIDAGQEASVVDRVAGLLIKPLSVLAGLILL